MAKLRVVHYINQFFAQIGGEEKADYPAEIRVGEVVLSRAVVRPLLRLAQASRSIAEGDFSRPDLPVKSSDEVGRLTGTFNQMKHAMAQQLTTQQALHPSSSALPC